MLSRLEGVWRWYSDCRLRVPMSIASDVRLALRSLRRRPAFTLFACAILALGIGANTAMFSVVDAVLIRSLPFRDVDSVVVVFADGRPLGLDDRLPTTAGDFLDWRDGQQVFSGLAALRNETRRITSLDTPVVPLVHAVTADYFDVLGVRPLLGRTFAPGEDAAGKDDVVILSYGVWQASFGGDPSVVGRKVTLDERPYTVIGVMRPDLWSAHLFAVQPGLWIPSPFESLRNERRRAAAHDDGGGPLRRRRAALPGAARRRSERAERDATRRAAGLLRDDGHPTAARARRAARRRCCRSARGGEQ
jgi:putative ABC transport system permease protein